MIAERDWFAVLKSTLQGDDSVQTLSTDDVDVLIADIVSGRTAPSTAPRLRRPKRRWFAVGAAVGLLGGGATAAAVWNRSKPEHPQEGVACHATADLAETRTVVIPPAADALAGCAELWLSGALPDPDGGASSDAAPDLFACIGAGGGLEVFPRLSDVRVTCADIRLADAITQVGSDPLVALQDRLSVEINEGCTDLDSARELAEQALADLALESWTVTVHPDAKGCVKAGQDPNAKSVYLFSLPT